MGLVNISIICILMKEKLIKDHQEYMLIDKDRNLIGTTDKSILGVTDKMKLSKQNCEEEFAKAMGVVDVEKLANDSFDKKFSKDSEQLGLYDIGFIDGFNKAMELNKDKVFTYNQMVSAITESSISHRLPSLIIQDLQPTEIEVEIVMERSKFIVDKSQRDNVSNGFNYRPKLDSSGNLILKKI